MQQLKTLLLKSKSLQSFSRNTFASSQSYMDLEDKYGCHNYAPQQVVLQSGEGIYVTDVEGKKYMDFLAAYSAVNQGHCHPKILATFIDQAKKVTLTSRAFYNSNLGVLEEFLHKTFGYDKSLLMNTGCEATESCVKYARRWGYNVKGIPENKARVAFAIGNFWGRSIAACGSSEDPSRHYRFGPYDGLNFDLIEYNNAEALENYLKANPNCCAYVLEPIQGEMGVLMPSDTYLKQVRQLCDKYNVLMVVDEVQTGLGRTGKLLCHYWSDVRPDMVAMGKALSGGFYPVSCALADDKVMNEINPGEHGSTYGGNPLGAAVAITAIQVLIEEKMIENSLEQGELLLSYFKQLDYSCIKEVRGKGLFTAIEFHDSPGQKKAYELCSKMKEKGLLAKPTHENTIRFSPPLVINKKQIEEAAEIVKQSFIDCKF